MDELFVGEDGLLVDDLELVSLEDKADLVVGVCVLVREGELLLHDLVREVEEQEVLSSERAEEGELDHGVDALLVEEVDVLLRVELAELLRHVLELLRSHVWRCLR